VVVVGSTLGAVRVTVPVIGGGTRGHRVAVTVHGRLLLALLEVGFGGLVGVRQLRPAVTALLQLGVGVVVGPALVALLATRLLEVRLHDLVVSLRVRHGLVPVLPGVWDLRLEGGSLPVRDGDDAALHRVGVVGVADEPARVFHVLGGVDREAAVRPGEVLGGKLVAVHTTAHTGVEVTLLDVHVRVLLDAATGDLVLDLLVRGGDLAGLAEGRGTTSEPLVGGLQVVVGEVTWLGVPGREPIGGVRLGVPGGVRGGGGGVGDVTGYRTASAHVDPAVLVAL